MKNAELAAIISEKVLFFRGQPVMLDKDLAGLYGVATKILNQAVKRNPKRFPPDFMFQLRYEELSASRSQTVTLKRGQNLKYPPYVFTEQGVAMLSSVLQSDRAIAVNIAIMRAFVKIRNLAGSHGEFATKLAAIEKRFLEHDRKFEAVFEAIRQLMTAGSPPPQKKIRGLGR